jgi:sigma-B regulation protein RsbU (phosphoserine phosphatase)
MSASLLSQSVFGRLLDLITSTQFFIFIFMAVVTKMQTILRVIFKRTQLIDYVVFILLFGLFSIFGTYLGIPEKYGAIGNVRDLAPMVAGLVAGPYAGLAVGLIGGTHRLFLGGDTGIPCSLATVLAGLLAGVVYRLNKGKLLEVIPAMAFAAGIELLHGGIILLIARPFTEAVEIVRATTPETIIANMLGMGVSFVILHNIIRTERLAERPVTPE